ncbi:MAG: NgoFVII family restriction endonuclease [Acidimicrobiaceae bacterium]|nr:NgoFVII family restriction endonuclease [Acidimicrobiaceae bacterium]
MPVEPIDERIDRFLTDNPTDSLLVAVGYATPAGLAWLHQRTQGRSVSVLIGDTRKTYWKNVSESDRVDACRFLQRDDVEVHNWYRTNRSSQGASEAHLKAWLTYNNHSVSAALVGSANLTMNGLHSNTEIMVEPAQFEHKNVWSIAYELWSKSWDAKQRLLDYLDYLDEDDEDDEDSIDHRLRPAPDASSRRSALEASQSGPYGSNPIWLKFRRFMQRLAEDPDRTRHRSSGGSSYRSSSDRHRSGSSHRRRRGGSGSSKDPYGW